MKLALRTRILIVLLIVTTILGATAYVIFQHVLLPRFVELERRHIHSHVEQISQSLQNELQHLDTLLHDWSAWDPTYQYALDFNVEFEISQLTVASLLNNELNLVLILDRTGQKLWGNVIDDAFEQSIVAKPFDQSLFTEDFPLLRFSDTLPVEKQQIMGLVTTSAGLMLCAARPILDSNENGPSRGTLIMGRFLGEPMLKKLRELTGIPFTAKPLYPRQKPEGLGALTLLQQTLPITLEANQETITATTTYKDLARQPTLRLQVVENREIVKQGLEALRIAMFMTLCGVIAALALMLLMLQRSVVTPLNRITRNIVSYHNEEENRERLDMSFCTSKELCLLSAEFNALMDSLAAKREQLSEAHFNLLNETKKLKQAETHLKSLDKMKSEFISTAAHELRTPVASIMGYTELLSDERLIASLDPGQRDDFYAEIIQNSERLTKIIDDVLDVSRIEAGQSIPLAKEKAVLQEILGKCVNRFKLSSNRSFIVNTAPDIPRTFVMDSHRIHQVVDNLLSNAIKYSPADTPIAIEVTREGRHCKVMIADHGIGMSPEQTQRVFDKFYRADTTNTAVRGLGLGMSIVKQIVEDHGGTIWVDSILGEGTRVYFTLPVDTPEDHKE